MEGEASCESNFDEREDERFCEKKGDRRWSPDVESPALWKESGGPDP